MAMTSEMIQPSDTNIYSTASNTAFTAVGGDHLLFLGGSSDTVNMTGGFAMIDTWGAGDTINVSATSDTIIVSGGHTTINASGGVNAIFDESASDTVVVPGAGGGFDSINLVSGAAPALDFRAALTATNWDGSAGDLSNYIHVASAVTSTGATGVDISLSATANGAATAVASVAVIGGAQWDASVVMSHVVS